MREPTFSPLTAEALDRSRRAFSPTRRRLLAAGLGALGLAGLLRSTRAGDGSYAVKDVDPVCDTAVPDVDPDRLSSTSGPTDALAMVPVLKLPERQETPTEEPTSRGTSNASAYVVQPGDTLWDIATALKVDVEDLALANGLGGSSNLQIGQTLVVPNGATLSTSSAVVRAEYRSQFDGSAYAGSNCGPAALGMLLDYYGDHPSTETLRRYAGQQMGSLDTEGGTTWESLAYAARQRGFGTVGLYDGGAYRLWQDADALGDHPIARPILALMSFRALPGHEGSSYYGDHYVMLLGRNIRGEAVYHDPAFEDWTGAYRTMTAAQLDRAWSETWAGQVRTGMGLERLG